ncbi:hypothetical protein [Aquabacter spiritensis]|uniref:Beta-barrel assembly machine subunit BamE n=1 Tax=Aquabacter spiritensis TaxID=933073 RepID=A0A4R3LKA6_9HYPH|nr:hypothetical protein [Aquabacter spiritensis]TCT00614.1 hypothetical protein EDC64_12135 [Aquabacter spiritensis]
MKLKAIALATLASLTLGACVTATQNKENMLAAAGFRMRLADTPDKIASLKTLPPHKFTVQNQNGQPVYIYADPTVCGCIYYGTQDNYANYQQMMFQQRLANQQQMTAMMNQQMAFDYGPWGGPFMPMY